MPVKKLLRYGRIDPLEYYVNHTYRVVYVENAKVASTAIKALLLPHLSLEILGQTGFHEASRLYAHYQLPKGIEDYLRFSVFRHPAERLTSCHKDKIVRLGN